MERSSNPILELKQAIERLDLYAHLQAQQGETQKAWELFQALDDLKAKLARLQGQAQRKTLN